MPNDQTCRKVLKPCDLCPHQNDCLNVGACLDVINAPLITSRQFPRRMTPFKPTSLWPLYALVER